MSKWVNARHFIGDRTATLVLSFRSAVDEPLMRGLADSPEVVEDLVLRTIRELRPELDGGTLIMMECDPAWKAWRFTYTHPSFEPVQPGMRLPEMPLIPEVRPDAVAWPVA